jgi:UDPglucose 6-dehydrogenase
MKHKIGIIGCGFVGSAVSTGFQHFFSESQMQILEHDKFKPTDSLDSVVNKSEILFICLPTPMNFETGECNLSIIETEVENINKIAKKRKVIVMKSTVPPGTTARLQEKYPKHVFVFNPEFLREKTFIQDFIEQDRIILGYTGIEGFEKLDSLYEDFTLFQKVPADIVKCMSSEAEMTKYVANCFLSTKVAFFNEIYEICKAAAIPYETVVKLVILDKRIGDSHTNVPGHDGLKGFGGSCFSKDINALMSYAKDLNIDPMILETVWTKNLLVREEYDWEKLSQVNGKYGKSE